VVNAAPGADDGNALGETPLRLVVSDADALPAWCDDARSLRQLHLRARLRSVATVVTG
jgi:hypothetical protein